MEKILTLGIIAIAAAGLLSVTVMQAVGISSQQALGKCDLGSRQFNNSRGNCAIDE
jgi:hypothetical protein